MSLTEMLFVPLGPRDDCIVCRPSAEVIVDSLRQGSMTFCIPHLLDASLHLSGVAPEDRQPRTLPPRTPGVP